MSTEIKMKKTKTSLVNGKSYLILNFVDEAGNQIPYAIGSYPYVQ